MRNMLTAIVTTVIDSNSTHCRKVSWEISKIVLRSLLVNPLHSYKKQNLTFFSILMQGAYQCVTWVLTIIFQPWDNSNQARLQTPAQGKRIHLPPGISSASWSS